MALGREENAVICRERSDAAIQSPGRPWTASLIVRGDGIFILDGATIAGVDPYSFWAASNTLPV